MQTSIPEDAIDFRISYHTQGRTSFVASRIGGIYKNCAKVDSHTLAVYIPLSEAPIGIGPMIRKLSMTIPAPILPLKAMKITVPAKTNLELYDGASDFDGPSVDECVIPNLQKLGI